jgi:hypothetical protein
MCQIVDMRVLMLQVHITPSSGIASSRIRLKMARLSHPTLLRAAMKTHHLRAVSVATVLAVGAVAVALAAWPVRKPQPEPVQPAPTGSSTLSACAAKAFPTWSSKPVDSPARSEPNFQACQYSATSSVM